MAEWASSALTIAFISSVFRSGEFANCSLVLLAACCFNVSDFRVHFATRSSLAKKAHDFGGLRPISFRVNLRHVSSCVTSGALRSLKVEATTNLSGGRMPKPVRRPKFEQPLIVRPGRVGHPQCLVDHVASPVDRPSIRVRAIELTRPTLRPRLGTACGLGSASSVIGVARDALRDGNVPTPPDKSSSLSPGGRGNSLEFPTSWAL